MRDDEVQDDEGRRCGTDELTPNRRYGDYFAVCRRETASLSRQRLVLAFSIRNSLDRVQQLRRRCELITGRGSR
jgi:hypothetical protein